MLKWLAVLGNLFAIGFVVYLIKIDRPPENPEEYGLAAAFLVSPAINLLCILRPRPGTPDQERLWHLFFEAQKSKLHKQIADTKSQ